MKKQIVEMDEEELEQHCLNEYWRAAKRDKKENGVDWPIPSSRGYWEGDVFHLRNGSGILARFILGEDSVNLISS
jgi:hypothetical protein